MWYFNGKDAIALKSSTFNNIRLFITIECFHLDIVSERLLWIHLLRSKEENYQHKDNYWLTKNLMPTCLTIFFFISNIFIKVFLVYDLVFPWLLFLMNLIDEFKVWFCLPKHSLMINQLSHISFVQYGIFSSFLIFLLLFHSPKGSWNKKQKYKKLGKYLPYCTLHCMITSTY